MVFLGLNYYNRHKQHNSLYFMLSPINHIHPFCITNFKHLTTSCFENFSTLFEYPVFALFVSHTMAYKKDPTIITLKAYQEVIYLSTPFARDQNLCNCKVELNKGK
jgi:hypothetical protein